MFCSIVQLTTQEVTLVMGRKVLRKPRPCRHALTHYDPSKAPVLVCDTSPNGLGAVLSHIPYMYLISWVKFSWCGPPNVLNFVGTNFRGGISTSRKSLNYKPF